MYMFILFLLCNDQTNFHTYIHRPVVGYSHLREDLLRDDDAVGIFSVLSEGDGGDD